MSWAAGFLLFLGFTFITASEIWGGVHEGHVNAGRIIFALVFFVVLAFALRRFDKSIRKPKQR